MSDYPRMLYKAGGDEEIHGLLCQWRIVADEDEHAAAMVDGWHLTPANATAPILVPLADDAPPTRAELERKASELGIAFDGRTTDTRLSSKIAQVLEAA